MKDIVTASKCFPTQCCFCKDKEGNISGIRGDITNDGTNGQNKTQWQGPSVASGVFPICAKSGPDHKQGNVGHPKPRDLLWNYPLSYSRSWRTRKRQRTVELWQLFAGNPGAEVSFLILTADMEWDRDSMPWAAGVTSLFSCSLVCVSCFLESVPNS